MHSPGNNSCIERLPNEIIRKILGYLEHVDLINVLLVSKRCHRIAFDIMNIVQINTELSISCDSKILQGIHLFKNVAVATGTNKLIRNLVVINRAKNPMYLPKEVDHWLGEDSMNNRKTFVVNLFPIIRGSSFVHQDTKFISGLLSLLFDLSTNIDSLEITEINMIDDHFNHIPGKVLQNLRSLQITKCENVTNYAMNLIGFHCKRLEYLAIQDCTYINDTGIMNIVKNCPLIKEFNLSGTNVTKLGVCSISDYCSEIKVLTLTRCKNINDEDLGCISKTFKVLETLDISSNWERITDKGIQLMARSCKSLKHLNISESSRVSDLAIFVIADYCKNLRSLNIQDCLKVTRKGITYAVDTCQRIESLFLGRCQIDKLFVWIPRNRATDYQYLCAKHPTMKITKLYVDYYCLKK